ncbi:hypothetical protein J6590_055924 [Homalodisca vitripennis]|nr:hypothetical protein J6590_055924 [Homalodisca vitripennis]
MVDARRLNRTELDDSFRREIQPEHVTSRHRIIYGFLFVHKTPAFREQNVGALGKPPRVFHPRQIVFFPIHQSATAVEADCPVVSTGEKESSIAQYGNDISVLLMVCGCFTGGSPMESTEALLTFLMLCAALGFTIYLVMFVLGIPALKWGDTYGGLDSKPNPKTSGSRTDGRYFSPIVPEPAQNGRLHRPEPLRTVTSPPNLWSNRKVTRSGSRHDYVTHTNQNVERPLLPADQERRAGPAAPPESRQQSVHHTRQILSHQPRVPPPSTEQNRRDTPSNAGVPAVSSVLGTAVGTVVATVTRGGSPRLRNAGPTRFELPIRVLADAATSHQSRVIQSPRQNQRPDPVIQAPVPPSNTRPGPREPSPQTNRPPQWRAKLSRQTPRSSELPIKSDTAEKQESPGSTENYRSQQLPTREPPRLELANRPTEHNKQHDTPVPPRWAPGSEIQTRPAGAVRTSTTAASQENRESPTPVENHRAVRPPSQEPSRLGLPTRPTENNRQYDSQGSLQLPPRWAPRSEIQTRPTNWARPAAASPQNRESPISVGNNRPAQLPSRGLPSSDIPIRPTVEVQPIATTENRRDSPESSPPNPPAVVSRRMTDFVKISEMIPEEKSFTDEKLNTCHITVNSKCLMGAIDRIKELAPAGTTSDVSFLVVQFKQSDNQSLKRHEKSLRKALKVHLDKNNNNMCRLARFKFRSGYGSPLEFYDFTPYLGKFAPLYNPYTNAADGRTRCEWKKCFSETWFDKSKCANLKYVSILVPKK